MRRTLIAAVIVLLCCTSLYALDPAAEELLLKVHSDFAQDLYNLDPKAVTLTVLDPAAMRKVALWDIEATLTWANMPVTQQKAFTYSPVRNENNSYPVLITDTTNNDRDLFRQLAFGGGYRVVQYQTRDVIREVEYVGQRITTFQKKYAYRLEFNHQISPFIHSFLNDWHEIALEIRNNDVFYGANAGRSFANWTCAIGGGVLASFGVMGLVMENNSENPELMSALLLGGGTVLVSIPFLGQAAVKKEGVEKFQKLIDRYKEDLDGVLVLESR